LTVVPLNETEALTTVKPGYASISDPSSAMPAAVIAARCSGGFES